MNQGSGFVADVDLVVTNAHVVAGTTEQWVQFGGTRTEATVVAFDPDLDIAVLFARGLDLLPLPLLRGEASRGDVGAVLGYPGGGSLAWGDAAVRTVIEPVGRDIYGDGQVRRRIYEIQAPVAPRQQRRPFVLESGRVAGLVFASSIADGDVGYAIVTERVRPDAAAPQTLTAAVPTGACAS